MKRPNTCGLINGFRCLFVGCQLAMLAACGQGGAEGHSQPTPTPVGEPTPSPEPSAAPTPTTSPTPDPVGRFSPTSYPEFSTNRGADNLEGTWLAFVRGSLTYQESLAMQGSNLRMEHDLTGRTLIRITYNSLYDRYFLNSCSPQASVSNTSARFELPQIEVLFTPVRFGNTTLIHTLYVNGIDATLEGRMQSDGDGLRDRNGAQYTWDIDWHAKRISDDAEKSIGTFTDTLTSVTEEVGCFFEAEGTYVESQDDRQRADFYRQGQFSWASSFRPAERTVPGPQEFSAIQFLLANYEDGFRLIFDNDAEPYGSHFDSAEGDQVIVESRIRNNRARYSAQMESAQARPPVSAVLVISP